jgi:hypothetical protein
LLSNDTTSYPEIAYEPLVGFFEDAGTSFAPVITARPFGNAGQQLVPKYDDNGVPLADRASGPLPPETPYWSEPFPYKILRQPVPTSDEPYQLPEGTVVDLRASGVGDFQFFFWPTQVDNRDNVILMFAPEGRIERVRYSLAPVGGYFDQPVVDNVYVLVGPNVPAPPALDSDPTIDANKWTLLGTDEEKQRAREPINWLRGDATWLVVGATTGRVVTNENGFVNPEPVMMSLGNPNPPTEDVRSGQIVAARRFARGMEQVGGR